MCRWHGRGLQLLRQLLPLLAHLWRRSAVYNVTRTLCAYLSLLHEACLARAASTPLNAFAAPAAGGPTWEHTLMDLLVLATGLARMSPQPAEVRVVQWRMSSPTSVVFCMYVQCCLHGHVPPMLVIFVCLLPEAQHSMT